MSDSRWNLVIPLLSSCGSEPLRLHNDRELSCAAKSFHFIFAQPAASAQLKAVMRPGDKQFSVLIPEKKMPSAAQSWGIEQSEAKYSKTLMRKK
jgi:hypothetical protein